MKNHNRVAGVRSWITPPDCQGQIVTASYGSDHQGSVFRRVFDASDQSTAYYEADAECGCEHECECFDPANAEPSGEIFAWARIIEERS